MYVIKFHFMGSIADMEIKKERLSELKDKSVEIFQS